MALAFDKKFFEKQQNHLLRFVNSRLGRWFFAIRKNDIPLSTKIMEIMPNRVSYDYKLIGNRLQKTTAFRTHNRYQKRLEYVYSRAVALLPFSAVTLERMMLPHPVFGFMPLLALSTLTVYPDAGNPGTTSCDGQVRRGGVDETWSTIRNGAGNFVDQTTADNQYGCFISASPTTNQWAYITRGIFLYDTSALGASATVSAATLSLCSATVNKADALGITPDLNIYASTPGSNTVLAASDYSQIGTTAFSTAITYANWAATGTYNDFVLNASGLAAISLTGVSKYGSRNANYDVANSAPGSWTSNLSSALRCQMSDTSGTSADPKLVITYTVPANSAMMMFF